MKFKLMFQLEFTTSPGGGGGWVLDFLRLMQITTQVEVVVELGNFSLYLCRNPDSKCNAIYIGLCCHLEGAT